MEFGVIIHDMTYVVVAIISGISAIGLKGALVVLGAAFWHVGHVLQNCSTKLLGRSNLVAQIVDIVACVSGC